MVLLGEILQKTKMAMIWEVMREDLITHAINGWLEGEEELSCLDQAVCIILNEIEMEFGLTKCATIVMRQNKLVRIEGIC